MPTEPMRDQPTERSEYSWAPSEQQTMGDGQLGSDLLDAGPEGTNPEGTAGIARPLLPAQDVLSAGKGEPGVSQHVEWPR